MGLFDFFKSKPEPELEEDELTLVDDDDVGPDPDYVMAHYALRSLALSDPLRCFGVLGTKVAGKFIEAVMKDVAQTCDRPPSYPSEAVKIHKLRAGRYPCAVVEFPAPKEAAEAFMIALVVPFDMMNETPPESVDWLGRYFTLEKGTTFTNEPRTVLAEWSKDSHLNYGDGPAPNAEAFAAAIGEHLARE